MTHWTNRIRVSGFCVVALFALSAACTQSDPGSTPKKSGTTAVASAGADLPEVVIIASRTQASPMDALSEARRAERDRRPLPNRR
jgi:hypothetical protein